MTELPPLPEPDGVIVVGTQARRAFTADAMEGYAAEAVRVALEDAAQECEKMRRDTVQLKAYEQAASYANARDAVFALIPKDRT